MGMMGAASAGLGLGQQNANNPNVGANFSNPLGLGSIGGSLFGGSGSAGSIMSNLDPLGNFITGLGGDPSNLYGNKNNPNAVLFPSNSASSNQPTTMPNLGANTLNPTMPSGTWGMNPYGSGMFNAMANQSAGQLFTPNGIQQNNPANPMASGSPMNSGPINSNPYAGSPASGIGPLGTPGNLPASYTTMSQEVGPNYQDGHVMAQAKALGYLPSNYQSASLIGSPLPPQAGPITHGVSNPLDRLGGTIGGSKPGRLPVLSSPYNPSGGPR